MSIEERIKDATDQGYANVRHIEGRGICGLHSMAFTVGLFYGIDSYGYKARYCYQDAEEAIHDLRTWDGKDDPSGNWIKRKGHGGDFSNPNYIDYSKKINETNNETVDK